MALTPSVLAELSSRTSREQCRTSLPQLQRPLAVAPKQLRWTTEGCGKWIPAEFRMCVSDAASVLPADVREVAITARDGEFSAIRLEGAGLEVSNHCRQSAFFHFQEWKKIWASGTDSASDAGSSSRIAPLRAEQLLNAPPFRVTTAGIGFLAPT